MLTRKFFRCWGCSRTVWMIFSLMTLFLILSSALAQEAADNTAPDQPSMEGATTAQPVETQPVIQPGIQPPAEKTSWLGFLLKGGLTMIPIVICSIGFIAIVAVKFPIFKLMRFSINPFAQSLTESVTAGEIDGAIVRCEQINNAITRPLQKGLEAYKRDPSRTGDSLREAMLDEMPGLESYVGWLGIIAGVAPLLGLFGTVVGIIQAFIELAAGGAVTDPSSFASLADGIYKALITTAAGLFVGIPALVMYEYFRMKISDLMRDMDRISVSLLNALGIGTGEQL